MARKYTVDSTGTGYLDLVTDYVSGVGDEIVSGIFTSSWTDGGSFWRSFDVYREGKKVQTITIRVEP